MTASLKAALLFFALALTAALVFAGCGGGGGRATTASTSSGASTATPAQARRAESAGQSPSGAPAYNQNLLSFRAAPLSAAQRSDLQRRGITSLSVRVKKPGTLSASGQAQPGLSILKVARAAPVTATAPGTATLTLRLTPAARGILARGHRLLMYLAIRYSRSRTMQQFVVPLGAGR